MLTPSHGHTFSWTLLEPCNGFLDNEQKRGPARNALALSLLNSSNRSQQWWNKMPVLLLVARVREVRNRLLWRVLRTSPPQIDIEPESTRAGASSHLAAC